jgi:hypothetical protein
MPTSKDNADEANFMSRMLSWDEVMNLATEDGYTGTRKVGEVSRYLAWRLFQSKRGTGSRKRD